MTRARVFRALTLFSILALASACKDKPSAEALEAFPATDAARIADAVVADDGPKIQALIKAGANPSQNGAEGRSLLEFAIWKEKPKAFAALLAAGADTTHADGQGDTALHMGAKDDDATYVTALLEKKVDPNLLNAQSGVSAVMDAALTGHLPQMHALLQAGAKLDFTRSNGDTALIMAAQANHWQAVLDLLVAGADPLAKNKIGATFQRYLNLAPTDHLTLEAQRERDQINSWLTLHNVPIEKS
jgi:ankyrin repeat protein